MNPLCIHQRADLFDSFDRLLRNLPRRRAVKRRTRTRRLKLSLLLVSFHFSTNLQSPLFLTISTCALSKPTQSQASERPRRMLPLPPRSPSPSPRLPEVTTLQALPSGLPTFLGSSTTLGLRSSSSLLETLLLSDSKPTGRLVDREELDTSSSLMRRPLPRCTTRPRRRRL